MRTLSQCTISVVGISLALHFVLRTGAAAHSLPTSTDQSIALSVLSYNTHGLPAWIARDRPHVRFPIIGQLTNRYDVVLLQEDFAYHRLLVKRATHQIIARGNGARPTLPRLTRYLCGTCGSGLTLLAHFPRTHLLNLDRKSFRVCAGWIRRARDCWATKGFMQARLRLQNGAVIDFYNVHLDAGTSRQDRKARQQQLQFLQQHVEKHSNDRALVIGGDFNLWSDHTADQALLQKFRTHLGLRNSGARSHHFLDRPEVDYILYRSGKETSLAVTTAGAAEEFVFDGKPLSDHPAITARFRVQTVREESDRNIACKDD